LLQLSIRKRLESDKSGSFLLDVTFVADRGITILFGKSGAGKTTTLRAIAGIVKPDEGRILIGSTVCFDSDAGIDLSIQARRVGYVFQDYALFPHLTAEQNVAYGIKQSGNRQSQLERARELLTLFKLDHAMQRYPRKMSGGEQQRTALARALASDPAVVLLDEPLSAVDAETRKHLLDEIASVQERVRIPFIYVTHNTTEAARLGSRVVRLRHGRVEISGPPSEVFTAEESSF
jgi:molybdate transport system ATP-binding protein